MATTDTLSDPVIDAEPRIGPAIDTLGPGADSVTMPASVVTSPPAPRPPSASEFFRNPKYTEASTEERLAALDRWAAYATDWVAANRTDYHPTERAKQTAKIREMRETILEGKTWGEKAGDLGRDVGVSLAASGVAATAYSAALANAAMGKPGDLEEVTELLGESTVQILDRLGERRETTDPEEVAALTGQGFTARTRERVIPGSQGSVVEETYVDRREQLDNRLAQFKAELDLGQFPAEPEAFVGWLKDSNAAILRLAGDYNGEGPEAYTDQPTRRFDGDLELQRLLAEYSGTRNDAHFAEITRRLTATTTREQSERDEADVIAESEGVVGEIRDKGETLDGPLAGPLRALLGAEGVAEASLDAAGDPVEMASTVISAVLTGGTAKAIGSVAGATRAGRALKVGSHVVADAAVEAGTEAFQAYVEDSRGDILEAAKRGALVGLAFQVTGATAGGLKLAGEAAVRQTASRAMGASPAAYRVDDRIFVPEGDGWREILPKGREAQGSEIYDARRDANGLDVLLRLEKARHNRLQSEQAVEASEESASPLDGTDRTSDSQPVGNTNLSAPDANERTAAGNEAGSQGRQVNPGPLRPEDWRVERPDIDARGSARIGAEAIRDVYRRLPPEEHGPRDAAWEETLAPSEIAAVAAGRKPVFHENIGPAAKGIAEALAPKFPGLSVEAFDGHLIVADPEQAAKVAGTDPADIEATMEKIREAARNDGIGEFLGYGAAHWQEADSIVEIIGADGQPIAGFHTTLDHAAEFAEDRKRDYSDATGESLDYTISPKALKTANPTGSNPAPNPVVSESAKVDATVQKPYDSKSEPKANSTASPDPDRSDDRSGEAAGNPLEELRARQEAVPRRKDGTDVGARLRAEAKSLLEWAAEAGRLLGPDESARLTEGRDRIGGATEHDVFLSEDGQRVVKITMPPNFGARGEVREYVRNATWANEMFGDDIRLEGVIETDAGPAIVTSQPFVEGREPTIDEIAAWFELQGYVADGYNKWRHPETGAVIADAHTGNLVMTDEGMVPIDLQILNPGKQESLSPPSEVADRTIDNGPVQRLGFAAMPNEAALRAEAGRAAAGAPPAPGDSWVSRLIYRVSSALLENGTLPKGMRELIRQAKYRAAGYEAMFSDLGNELNRSIRAHVGRARGPQAVQDRQRLGGLSYLALRGDAQSLAALPPDIQTRVSQGRQSIDLFSQQLVNDGIVDGDLATRIGDNLGQYLLREFRVFDPKANWNYETIREQHPGVYNAALQEIMATRQVTPEEADNAIREMTDPTRAEAFYFGTSTAGKVDVSSFIRRRDLSPAILDLLGEVRDPVANVRNTGKKIAKIWADHAAQSAMREFLLASGLATEDRSSAEGRNWHRIGEETYEVQVLGEDANGNPEINRYRHTRTRRSLAGFGELYVTPEMGAAVEHYFAAENPKDNLFRNLARLLATVTGTGKFMQVILNPAAYPTNMAGAVWTEIANGRVSPRGGLKFAQSMRDAARADDSKYTIQEQQGLYAQTGADFLNSGGTRNIRFEAFKHEMALRGIRDNSVFAEDLNETVKKGFGDRWKRVTAVGGKLYQIPDNAAKANAFAHELEKWAAAEPGRPLNELMDLAAADVRATTQNYDRVPEGIKRFSQYGLLVPTYISFSWELARNTVNTVRIAGREIRSGNPVLVRHGYQRIAGMMATAGALAVMNSLRGDWSEEEEAAIARSYVPPWLEGMGIMLLSSRGGTVRYADPAYLIPHQLFWNALEVGLKSEGPVDAVEDVASALLQGFSDMNIATQTMAEIIANRKVGGNPIWNEEIAQLDPGHKWSEVREHVIESMFTPGILRTMEKMRKAEKGEIGYMGSMATWDDIAAQAIGLRPYTVSIREATADKIKAFAQRYRIAASYASEGRLARLDPEERAREQAKEDAAIENLRGQLGQLKADARTLGISEDAWENMLKDAALPAKIRP